MPRHHESKATVEITDTHVVLSDGGSVLIEVPRDGYEVFQTRIHALLEDLLEHGDRTLRDYGLKPHIGLSAVGHWCMNPQHASAFYARDIKLRPLAELISLHALDLAAETTASLVLHLGMASDPTLTPFLFAPALEVAPIGRFSSEIGISGLLWLIDQHLGQHHPQLAPDRLKLVSKANLERMKKHAKESTKDFPERSRKSIDPSLLAVIYTEEQRLRERIAGDPDSFPTLAATALQTYTKNHLGRSSVKTHVVDWVLQRLAKLSKGKEATSRDAREMLASALQNELEQFSELAMEADSPARFGELFTEHLAAISPTGKEYVEKKSHPALKTDAPTWAHWLEPGKDGLCATLLRQFAGALWDGWVKGRIYDRQRQPPAVARVVHAKTLHVLTRPPSQPLIEANGQHTITMPGEHPVRIVPDETVNAIAIAKGLPLLRSRTSHALLRWLVFQAWSNHHEHAPTGTIVVDGGYAGLRRALGLTSNKATHQVRTILDALHGIDLNLHGEDTMFLVKREHVTRGRKRQLYLHIGEGLRPGYVQSQLSRKGLKARDAVKLVPVLSLPPPVGRPKDHGAQAAFQMRIVLHMRDYATELVDTGGVALPHGQLVQLADEVEMPRASVEPVITRWTHDGDDGPAVLKRLKKDLFTLGDHYEAERTFLEKGGKRSKNAAAHARRARKKPWKRD